MNPKFKFMPIQFNWVALNPKPIGVIYFIGGAFFGTFPTIFYRYILRKLFEKRYTIIALPYRFTFRHWSVSLGLVKDLSDLRQAIAIEAKRLGYEYKIYQEEPTSENPNYYWLAHSLGNKYVALLELLSELESKPLQEILGNCVGKDQAQEIEKSLQGVDLKDISLKNQPSILMAPAITGLEGAIPIRSLANLITNLGLDVKPNVKETHCLIQNSHLFNLTSLIAFDQDNIALETVNWLRQNLSDRLVRFIQLPGRHLTPLGFQDGDHQLAASVMQSLDTVTQKLVASPKS